MTEVIDFVCGYARSCAAPVQTGTTVTTVRPVDGGFEVHTSQGIWRADAVWLDAPVFDHRGRLRHDGGVVDWPGLYAVGLPVLRRRRSSCIDGAARDAAELTTHLTGHLDSLAGRHTRTAS